MKIPQRSPLVAVHKKSPFNLGPPLEHQRPSTTLGNLEVMLILCLGKPYRVPHVEEVIPRIEDSLDVEPFLVLLVSAMSFSEDGVLIHGDLVIRILGRILRLHVPIMPLQNNAQKVRTMVMKEPVVVASQPMVDPHRVSEEDKRPSY